MVKNAVRKAAIRIYHSKVGKWIWNQSVEFAKYNLVRKALVKVLSESGYRSNTSVSLVEGGLCDLRDVLYYGQSSKHALIIFPYYVVNASRAYIHNIAENLKELGYIVHAIQYNSAPIEVDDSCFDFIYNIKSNNPNFRRWDVHTEEPIFTKNKIDDWVDDVLLDNVAFLDRLFHFEMVICNYVFLSATLTRCSSEATKILITHDRFANRNAKLSANGVKPCYFDFSCTEKEEMKGLMRADVIMSIQDKESEAFKEMLPTKQVVTVPYVLLKKYLNREDTRVKDSLIVGYLASGHMPNLVALEKLLSLAIPKTIQIKVAGSICDSLYNIKVPENVELIGIVENVESFYKTCDVLINPDMVESGLKIKCVEALSFGIPLVCTKFASVGIPVSEAYHTCADIQTCANMLKRIVDQDLDLKKMAAESRRLYDLFVEKYSPYSEFKKVVLDKYYKNIPTVTLKHCPKVSVVMPIYKVERYLDQAICSVLTQTMSEIELIAVNDGSPDNCGQIIDEYAKRDNRVKVIHKENGGYGSAVNAGLKVATGEFVAILEPDDWIEPKMYEELFEIANKTSVDIVKGGFFKHYPAACTEIISIPHNKALRPEYWLEDSNNPVLALAESSIWSALYRRDFLLKNNITMFDLKGGSYQDVNWKFDVLSSASSICLTPKPYYHYRVMTQTSSSKSSKNPLNQFVNYEQIKMRLNVKGAWEKWRNLYYAHFYLDAVFHYDRLTSEAREEFLKEFANFIKQAENCKCGLANIRFPEELTYYVADRVASIYQEAKSKG